MKKVYLILILFLGLGISGDMLSQSYNLDNIPNPKHTDVDYYVSNPDGILSISTVDSLNMMLNNLKRENGSEVAVVAVNSIGEEDIFDFAVALFEKWGIGDKEVDNGLLVLFVLDQRKIRFEVGYGLEGVLPDAICKRIQTQDMIPYFKKENYDQGILTGVSKIADYILNDEIYKEDNEKQKEPYSMSPLIFVILGLVLVVSILWISKKYKQILTDTTLTDNNLKYQEMRKSISKMQKILLIGLIVAIVVLLILSFFRFYDLLISLLAGIGLIPANLMGKKYMKNIRNAPVNCDKCRSNMNRVPKNDKGKYLSLSQLHEEKIQSVDYDVFLCPSCNNTRVYEYDGKNPQEECPNCHTKSFGFLGSYISCQPTSYSTGTEIKSYSCSFCNHQVNKEHIIPTISQRSYSSGGGGSRGGSFGGGSSGGGGATSGW